MQMDEEGKQPKAGKLIEEDLTYRIRAGIFTVANELGPGFLERVYENALAIELSAAGLAVRTQCPIHVQYKGQIVGEYIADLVVEGRVLLELKAIRCLTSEHEAQIMNYLRATRLKVGLLVNFGKPSLQIKRFVL
ncbi:GxxExxY protein [Thiocapsa imhoffii]|uniref:GxxExxY protein n=1 Tax=Thiocapsa imhoffii TaxID=382777 RepID=A0A9X1BAC6_9GAMM|nr:GxxExxY protein [Thiocapsa imhoffii]MBK1646817.1 GxxExxY protein [Thiocapsa imhoffii]